MQQQQVCKECLSKIGALVVMEASICLKSFWFHFAHLGLG